MVKAGKLDRPNRLPMPLFQFETRERTGRVVRRRLAAESEEVAVRLIRAQGHYVISVQRVRAKREPSPARALRHALWPIPPRALALFFAQLGELLEAGFTVGDAIDRLKDRVGDRRLAEFCREAAREISEGTPLSEMMALRPRLFQDWVAASIAAGEQSGQLALIVSLLEQEFRGQTQFARQFTVASIYTRALLVAALMAATSPAIMALGMANWLVNIMEFLILAGLGWYVLRLVTRIGFVRKLLEKLWFILPMYGSYRRNLSNLRVQRALRELIKAGLSPQAALEAAAPLAEHWWQRRGLRRAAEVMRAGGSFGQAFRAAGIFDPRIVGLMETAEETGELESMIDEAIDTYDEWSKRDGLRATYTGWGCLIAVTAVVVIVAFYMGAKGYVMESFKEFEKWLEEI